MFLPKLHRESLVNDYFSSQGESTPAGLRPVKNGVITYLFDEMFYTGHFPMHPAAVVVQSQTPFLPTLLAATDRQAN